MTRITGMVRPDGDPIIHLTVIGNGTAIQDLPVLVDTGFTEYLALPANVVEALRLRAEQHSSYMLADGTTASKATYSAEVIWLEQVRRVPVIEVGGPALLGMNLLIGCRLHIDVVPGGTIEVSRLE